MSAPETQLAGQSFFDVLRRRRAIALTTFSIVVALSLAFVFIHKFSYAALSHVALVNDPTVRDPTVMGVDMPLIATGSTVLIAVRQQLGLERSVTDLREVVLARISPRSSVMTISAQDHDPDTAMRIDNAVADTFARLYSHLAHSRYEEVTTRLTSDEGHARERVGVLERQLEAAAAGAAYVGSQASLDASASHLGELQEARGITLGQLATDQANLTADRNQPGKSGNIVRYEILHNNQTYQQTDTSVSKDVAQYTTLRASVKAGYPGIAGFRDKVSQEARALADLRLKALRSKDAYSPSQAGAVMQTVRDAAAVDGDRVKVAELDAQIRILQQTLRDPRGSVRSLGALRVERDAAEAQLQTISLARSNAEVSSAQASALGEVFVVDRATEARPTLLGPGLLLVLGVLAALILAAGSAYLAESIVPRFLGWADIEGVYGRPLVATLR